MEKKTNFKSYVDSWTRNLSAMYNDQLHADVTLICEGNKILAHRSVLATFSPLFSQLLLGCESLVEPTIFLEGFSYRVMVCLVNFLYNGIAEGSSDDLVTVSKYAKELQVKGLVNSGHGAQQFQLELLEKRKVEEQLQKLQSHECDSDSNSSEDEDLQIVFENVQEAPMKRDEGNELIKNNLNKRKRQISNSTPTDKRIVLDPTGPGTAESAKSAIPVLKAITCSICKEIFKTKSDLRSHLGTQHSDQLTCSICGKLFISRITLRRHLRKHISSFDGLLVSLSSSNCLPNLKEMPDITTMENN